LAGLLKYIIPFLFLANTFVQAQNVAKFSVNAEVGCAPFTVIVTDESTAPPGTNINFDYGDGTPLTDDLTHTYSNPGTYDIIQTVANASTQDDAKDTVTVEVVAPQAPDFSVANCKGTEAFLFVQNEYYEAYRIEWGDGNADITTNGSLITHNYPSINTYTISVQGLINDGQSDTDQANVNCGVSQQDIVLIDDIVEASFDSAIVTVKAEVNGSVRLRYNTNPQTAYMLEIKEMNAPNYEVIDTITANYQPDTYTITGLNTSAQSYCFRLTAFDPCDLSTLPSEPICSIQLNATPQNNQNQVEWNTTSSDFVRYEVLKNDALLTTISQINDQSYIDADVVCGSQYCYRVSMFNNNSVSVSDTVCVEAFSNDTPGPVINVSASVQEPAVALDWEPPATPAALFILARIDDNDSLVINEDILNASFSDLDANPEVKSNNYVLSYVDQCGNISDPTSFSPVFLSKSGNNALKWTDYVGWEAGVSHYILERYDASGNLLEEINMGVSTNYTEDYQPGSPQQLRYRIRAIPHEMMLEPVYSNFRDIVFPSTVFFPNAFTPNGDGLNDVFNFKGKHISNYKLYLYNRWGELIFVSEDPDRGWNGTINGQKAAADVYIYKAEFTDEMGVSFTKQGEVLLIK